jgi:succinyl-CoA synthetase alpha subunit
MANAVSTAAAKPVLVFILNPFSPDEKRGPVPGLRVSRGKMASAKTWSFLFPAKWE